MKILVTGANRGLGLSLVEAGLERGHVLIATFRSRKQEDLEKLNSLKQKFEEHLHLIPMDVTDEMSIREAKKKLEEITPAIDGIINNAGILLGREQKVEEVDVNDCKKCMDINALGPLRVVKHFLSLLKKGINPAIVNISSDAASLTNAYDGDYPYTLSKAALNMLTEKWRVSLKEEGFLVCSVHPGWMKTEMGGKQAPLNPRESAEGIFDIMERKIEIYSSYVDYMGKAMPL